VRELKVQYGTWKSLVDDAAWTVYWYPGKGSSYHIYTGHRDYAFISLAKGADKTDFETNYKVVGNECGGHEDALAKLIGATPATQLTAEGYTLMAPTFLHVNEAWRLQGELHFCPSGLSIHDTQIDVQILMDAGSYWTEGAHRGDYSEFAIVDKHDILGYHTLYSLPDGYPVELKKYVKEKYVQPGDNVGRIAPPTVAPVVSGLYVRHIYNNIGPEDVWVGVDYEWYENEQ
jgi:hypothetical protein